MTPAGNPRGWVRKAEQDYDAAVVLTSRRLTGFSDVVGFHAQQAAEKYLKAYLVRRRVAFPRTHDLVVLVGLALPFEPRWRTLLAASRRLNRFAVEFRYPGARATPAAARRAIQDVRRVRQAVRRRLGP